MLNFLQYDYFMPYSKYFNLTESYRFFNSRHSYLEKMSQIFRHLYFMDLHKYYYILKTIHLMYQVIRAYLRVNLFNLTNRYSIQFSELQDQYLNFNLLYLYFILVKLKYYQLVYKYYFTEYKNSKNMEIINSQWHNLCHQETKSAHNFHY